MPAPAWRCCRGRRRAPGDVSRPDKKTADSDGIPIEGAGVNPAFCSIGARYFFSDSLFAGFYYIVSLVREEGYVKDILGVDFSLQF